MSDDSDHDSTDREPTDRPSGTAGGTPPPDPPVAESPSRAPPPAEPVRTHRADEVDRADDGALDGDTDRDASLALSFAAYAARLLYAFLAVTARLLAAGVRIGVRVLGDADARRRARRWLFLEGDRRPIVAGFVVGVFGVALLLGVSDVIGVRESRFVTTMFSTMIAGLFSFIPIVVSVNQLIVSRLFGTPDRLTERIDGVRGFRRRVESHTEGNGVSPTDPAPFLARLAGSLAERADSLATACAERSAGDRTPALDAVCEYASRTNVHTETLCSRLTGETNSVFAVVLPTLNRDYAGDANEARRLERRFDEELPNRVTRLLSELQELYVVVDATRQYFTTIYLQQELARLSRQITYSGTAALLTSTLVIMIYASGYPPVAHEGPLLVLVSLALAVAFSPLAILFAYVLRIATILKRTSAPGAFTPPGGSPGDG